MSRIALALTAALAAVTAIILWSPGGGSQPAAAHGVVDQSQTQSTTVAFNNSHAMMQSFVPAADTLVAVDVEGHRFGSADPAARWSVAIRLEYPAGPIIAIKMMIGLPGPPESVLHVDFDEPIAVTPGQTYWLEVAAEGNSFHWSIQLTGDPYPAGEPDAVVTGFYPEADRWFVTYSAPPVTDTPSPTPTSDRPTRTPRP